MVQRENREGVLVIDRVKSAGALLVMALACAGSCAPRGGPDSPVDMYRAAAVITFGTGDGPLDVFAVPQVEVAPWFNAAWTNVSSGGSTTSTAYPLSPSAAPPTLFVAQRGPTGLSIRAMRVNSDLPPQTIDVEPVSSTSSVPEWCESESWIGAFFLAGIGPSPDQPVILEYRGEGSEHRLLVDPSRHTVRANAGLVVTGDHLRDTEEKGGYRVMSVQLARIAEEAFPLVVQMIGDSARISVGGRPQTFTWGMGEGQFDPRTQWKVYFLSALPGSDPSSPEIPDCEP